MSQLFASLPDGDARCKHFLGFSESDVRAAATCAALVLMHLGVCGGTPSCREIGHYCGPRSPGEAALDDDFVFGDVLLADLIAEAVRKAAGDVEGAPGAVRLDSWGSATLIYEIRR